MHERTLTPQCIYIVYKMIPIVLGLLCEKFLGMELSVPKLSTESFDHTSKRFVQKAEFAFWLAKTQQKDSIDCNVESRNNRKSLTCRTLVELLSSEITNSPLMLYQIVH